MSAALLPLLFWAGSALAVPHSIQPPAPEFPTASVWLNAKPLSLKQLRSRRVVVVAFLNLANLNSLRALSVLKAWDEQYGLDGLSVIGVEGPIYGFQKDPRAIQTALKQFKISFPVFVDDDRSLWKAYSNEGWPAFYLIDRKGNIIFDLLGEGAYADFEEELRVALDDAGYAVKGKPAAADPPREDCGAATPEVDLGSAARKAAAPIDLDAEENTATAEVIGSSRDGETSQHGSWRREPDHLKMTQANPEHDAFARVIYRGTQALGLLAGPGGSKPSRFFLRQDGLWLHSGNAGGDVKFDDDGRSYVTVDSPRLYWLVKNPNDSEHELRVMPALSGSAIYNFQFADRCLPYKP